MLACHPRNLSDEPEVPGFFPKAHQGDLSRCLPPATQDKWLEVRGDIHSLSADSRELG